MRHSKSGRGFSPGRPALTLPEALLVLAICGIFVLFLLTRLPRGREQSRSAICLANLNQIGQALGLHVEATGRYPINPSWNAPSADPGTSVLWQTRSQLDLWNFVDVRGQVAAKGKNRQGTRPLVPAGLRCPSDRAQAPLASTSYRADAGSESRGETGPFAIGRSVSPAEVEAADGLSFTAAFSERLIGSGSGASTAADYVEVETCAEASEALITEGNGTVARKGDAGHDWSRGDWVSTLYHHGLKPNAAVSAIATGEPCGEIGASSGHTGRVHVLLLDGSARAWRDQVDGTVWRRLGDIERRENP